jgi:hypothetical protein
VEVFVTPKLDALTRQSEPTEVKLRAVEGVGSPPVTKIDSLSPLVVTVMPPSQ